MDNFKKSHLFWKASVLRDFVRHCEYEAQIHAREIDAIQRQHHLPSSPKARMAMVVEQNARSFWYGEAIKHRLAHIDTIAEARS